LNHFTVPIAILVLRIVENLPPLTSERRVTPPHRTESGPALARAREGRPNHEEADEVKVGNSRGIYKFQRSSRRARRHFEVKIKVYYRASSSIGGDRSGGSNIALGLPPSG
jgi:hypothetical protein